MDIRLMNHHAHRKTKCINRNVFLAPFDLLVDVDPAKGANMVGGLDAAYQ